MIPSVGQNRRFCSNWSRSNKRPLFALMRIIKNYRTERLRRFHTTLESQKFNLYMNFDFVGDGWGGGRHQTLKW